MHNKIRMRDLKVSRAGDIIMPAKSSDKAEDLPLLGSFFEKLPPFRFFLILQLFPYFTRHSK